MSSVRRRQGFTLIELIVVMGIIAVLAALLVPAVQKVRQTANLMNCRHNLRQLGAALMNYHTTHSKFPQARPINTAPFAISAVPNTAPYPGSWIVRLLPYLDQDQLGKSIQASQSSPNDADYISGAVTQDNLHAQTLLRVLLCPSVPSDRTDAPSGMEGAKTCYLGVTGIHTVYDNPQFWATGDIDPNPNYPAPPPYPPNAQAEYGVFTPVLRGVKITDILDGASNTIMVGERPPSYDHNWGWYAWPDYHSLLATQNMTSMYPGCPGLPGVFSAPQGLRNDCDTQHYWSYHPSGGNWLFADGSVRYIGYAAWQQVVKAATIQGKEVIDESQF